MRLIQRSLFTLQQNLGRLERRLVEGLADVQRQPLHAALDLAFGDAGLGFSLDDFRNAEGVLYRWAQTTSTNTTFAGPAVLGASDVSDGTFVTTIGSFGVDGSINYLNQFAATYLGGRGFADDRLPNPI